MRPFSSETFGIPMGIGCAPLLADLFLYYHENEFLDKLVKEGKRKLARKFSLPYPYTDDLISLNNKRFKEFISDIYPKKLTISETIESTSVASYLDLLFTRENSNNITNKLYDKCDAFGNHIVKIILFWLNLSVILAFYFTMTYNTAHPCLYWWGDYSTPEPQLISEMICGQCCLCLHCTRSVLFSLIICKGLTLFSLLLYTGQRLFVTSIFKLHRSRITHKFCVAPYSNISVIFVTLLRLQLKTKLKVSL